MRDQGALLALTRLQRELGAVMGGLGAGAPVIVRVRRFYPDPGQPDHNLILLANGRSYDLTERESRRDGHSAAPEVEIEGAPGAQG